MSDYNEQPMSTSSWFWTLVLLSIPLVNVICFIVWVCGSGNRNRVTYCRATLILGLIGLLFYGTFMSLSYFPVN